MGMTLWLNIREGSSYRSNQVDHTAVLHLQDQLDALAAQLQTTPLAEFCDSTDCEYNLTDTGPDELADPEDEEQGWTADEARWYDASTLLATVHRLLDHLQHHPGLLGDDDGRWSQADVIEDLVDLRSELEPAAAAARQAHLSLVM